MLVISLLLGLKYLKIYTKFKKNLKFPRLASIKLGYYYAKKVDTHYYANLICKIIKKHLNIKDTTPGNVMSDLYSSTKFGPFYHYRNIQGFIKRSILFSQINRIT